jgi:hypothetical protein
MVVGIFSKNRTKKTGKWDGIDAMTLVPRHVCPCTRDPQSGLVTVLAPRFGANGPGRFLQRRLPPQRRHIQVRLEARGSFVWDLVDGKRTVLDLTRAFEAEFPAESQESPVRVGTFLMSLAQNGFIEFLNGPA